MSPFALNLEKIKVGNSLVMVEPAMNAFISMLLISTAKDEPGIHEWVTKTYAQMSSEEHFRHKLVTIGFHYSILPQVPGSSFEVLFGSARGHSPVRISESIAKCVLTNLFHQALAGD